MEFKILNDANDDIFSLRREVFIVEKHVPEKEEFDGQDAQHTHFCMYEEMSILACLRGEDVGEKIFHIGRFAVRKNLRGSGIGKKLIDNVCLYAKENGFVAVELSAMDSAVGFYKKQGFIEEGEYYLEAGIPHIYMKKIL